MAVQYKDLTKARKVIAVVMFIFAFFNSAYVQLNTPLLSTMIETQGWTNEMLCNLIVTMGNFAQIPAYLICLALGGRMNKKKMAYLSIACAGGYLLQLLPGATDAEITRLEQNIAAMPSVTEMLRAGKTPQDMMELAMAGFDPQVLDTREVKYQCDCSKERTKDMLLSLGRKELVKLRDEDPKCEVVCHFCHTKYEFDLNELLAETTPEEK